MIDRYAKQPFRFSSCMELREVLGKRAMDEHRLLELIEEAPADSIYLSKIHQGEIWGDSSGGTLERETGDRRRDRRHYRSSDPGGDRFHREFTGRSGILHQAFAERTRIDGRAGAAGERIYASSVS